MTRPPRVNVNGDPLPHHMYESAPVRLSNGTMLRLYYASGPFGIAGLEAMRYTESADAQPARMRGAL